MGGENGCKFGPLDLSHGTLSAFVTKTDLSGFKEFLKVHKTTLPAVQAAFEAAEEEFLQAQSNHCPLSWSTRLNHRGRRMTSTLPSLGRWATTADQLMNGYVALHCHAPMDTLGSMQQIATIFSWILLDFQELRDVAYAFCKAASVLHNKGLVHRDMRMSNVVRAGWSY